MEAIRLFFPFRRPVSVAVYVCLLVGLPLFLISFSPSASEPEDPDDDDASHFLRRKRDEGTRPPLTHHPLTLTASSMQPLFCLTGGAKVSVCVCVSQRMDAPAEPRQQNRSSSGSPFAHTGE